MKTRRVSIQAYILRIFPSQATINFEDKINGSPPIRDLIIDEDLPAEPAERERATPLFGKCSDSSSAAHALT
jgi:hypothetical protein